MESGNASEASARPQSQYWIESLEPAWVHDFLSSAGLGIGTLIEKSRFLPVQALDRNRSPSECKRFPWSCHAICPASQSFRGIGREGESLVGFWVSLRKKQKEKQKQGKEGQGSPLLDNVDPKAAVCKLSC